MRKLIITLFILISGIIVYSCGTESTPVYTLTSNVEPSEAGSISQSAAEAEEGESIQVTANANQHWVFNGWQGDLSGSQNPASVVMDRNKSLTARFVKRDYPLTINIEGSGEVKEEVVTARTTEYQHGTLVQLTAEPEDSWVFYEWSGGLNGNDNPETIEVDEGKEVTSIFKSIEDLLLIEITGEGTVDIRQESFENNPSRRNITLSSDPSENWQFLKWDGDIESEEDVLDISLNSVIELTAMFATTPIVETKEVTSITVNTVQAGGEITSTGNDHIIRSGVCWSTDPNPTLDDACIDADGAIDNFDLEIENLLPSTLYYIRAFASNSVGNSFGVQKQFTTLTPEPELQLWRGNTRLSLPYSASATISRASIPTPSVFDLFEFRLIAVAGSFTVSNVSAVDRNNVVTASFSGLSSGTTIAAGEEVTFILRSGRTFGRQTDLLFSFDVDGQNTPFSYRVIFTSN